MVSADGVWPIEQDLADPAFMGGTGAGDDFWAESRRRGVTWHEPRSDRPGFWIVSRYRDVRDAYVNVDGLSSSRGTVLDVLLRGPDSAGGKMLAVTDPPRHRELRILMARALSPEYVRRMEPTLLRRSRQLVRRWVGSGEFDFVESIADRLPIETICDVLQVPASDRTMLMEWNKQTLSSTSLDDTLLDALNARNEIILYFIDLVEERRAAPGDDPISALAHGRVQDEQLSTEDIALNCYSLILGGDESSRMSATSAVRALHGHPDQWRSLKSGSVDYDTAVEELIRWATPAMHFARTAEKDVTVGGTRIARGDVVSLWNASANRDEEAFDDPGSLNLSRRPNKHLGFGWGPHFCLGAALGRASLKYLLQALAESVASIETEEHPQRVYSNFLYGYRSLRTTLVP